MIYLIGGSPRGGKSILSRELSKKLNIPDISTDTLKQFLMTYFRKEERENMFPFEKIWNANDIDSYFQNYSGKQMIDIDIRESKTIWPGTKHLINHYLERKMDYIFEGVHLLPSLVKEFKSSRNIKILFLAKFDEEKIFKGFFKNVNNSDWIIDNAKDKNTIRLAAKSMSAYGAYFQREAKKHNFKLINTEDDFSRQINKALHSFTN